MRRKIRRDTADAQRGNSRLIELAGHRQVSVRLEPS